MPKRSEPQPPPILTLHTAEEAEDIERMLELLEQARRIAASGPAGAVARKRQFLNSVVNPHAMVFRFEDHEGRGQARVTFSSRLARDRVSSVRGLREEGLTREEVGALLGLTKTAVQAIEERSQGTRAKQKRISLTDAARLADLKARGESVRPAATDARSAPSSLPLRGEPTRDVEGRGTA